MTTIEKAGAPQQPASQIIDELSPIVPQVSFNDTPQARTGRLKAERTASGVRLFSRSDVERLAKELAKKRGWNA